jgi:hypothetical protein
MNNRKSSEKQEVINPSSASTAANEKYVLEDKYLQDTRSASTIYEGDKKSEEEVRTFGGDTALANAPWKFKIIALFTALMFPCKYT